MNKSLVTLLMIFIVQSSIAQTKKIIGFYDKNVDKELSLESIFDSNLSKTNIGETIKKLSEKPHHISSPGDKENVEYILNLFEKWGWDAKIETFYVLFPTPETRILEMTYPTSYKAILKEPALKEDATSGQPGQLATYNAYSADGDVTSELVFVNYGLPEDYEVLDNMGIDVKGKIVIAKYGRSWRGIKPKVAQEHGAIGCIIYSDPVDDGFFQGDVYPKGAFRNDYGVQRGSVIDMSAYPGDPLTPGIGATKDAKRLDRLQAPSLLKIPVLPISSHDAAPLLEALDGPVAPVGWHGGLSFAYHIGPGKAKVHLKVAFNWNVVPCYDVIAKIQGSKFPDQWVIRGNHQDAWVNGAGDPVSGQAAKLDAMGSGSDYSSFIQHAGIPSLNLGFGGEDGGGEYHSIYDSYSLYEKFKDPGFQYGVTLAETAGHAVLRMSNADGLPFDFTYLAKTIDTYSEELIALLTTSRETTDIENQIINSRGYAVGEDPTKGYIAPHVKPEVPYLDFSPLQNALRQLEKSADSLKVVFQKNIKTNHMNLAFNQSLYRAEQQLLNESGLSRRAWYKHTLYAPGLYTGYGVKTLPGIREAIEQRNWDEAQQQIEVDAKTIIRLAEYFKVLSSSGN